MPPPEFSPSADAGGCTRRGSPRARDRPRRLRGSASQHPVGKIESYFREGDQEAQGNGLRQDEGPYPTNHFIEGDLRHRSLDDEEIYAEWRRDHAHLDHLDHQDAEPDRIES